MIRCWLPFTVISAGLLIGCGSANDLSLAASSSSTGGNAATTSYSSGYLTIASSSGAGGEGANLTDETGDGCDGQLSGSIFLLGAQGGFYRFAPQTEELKFLGPLECDDPFQTTPFAMSVDRNGMAWVVYSSGVLFKVDTVTRACTITDYDYYDTAFDVFGMGFASKGPNSNEETLYVSHIGYYTSEPAKGLGKIDTTALELEAIAQYDLLPHGHADLTGTGDGRLFGFFQTSPLSIAEIDPSSAVILSQRALPELPANTSWAFAFWGGDLWVFTGGEIRRYNPDSHVLSPVLIDADFEIVGAGVSSCAPVAPPQ